jgi:hypothetical protein
VNPAGRSRRIFETLHVGDVRNCRLRLLAHCNTQSRLAS